MILPDSSHPITVTDLADIDTRRRGPADTLAQLVQRIQDHFRSDVCSVYLVEPNRAHLALAATVGLKPNSVGRVIKRF